MPASAKQKSTWGGAGRGQGRKPGSINKASRQLKELAQSYMPAAIGELVRIAGLAVRPKMKNGQPVMAQAFAEDGSPILDADSNATFRAVMEPAPGSASDTARIAAINTLLERGYGKATQPIAGDDDAPPVQISKVEFEDVPVGTPLNDDSLLDDEEGDEQASKVA